MMIAFCDCKSVSMDGSTLTDCSQFRQETEKVRLTGNAILRSASAGTPTLREFVDLSTRGLNGSNEARGDGLR